MDGIVEGIVELNRSDHLFFALLTVAIMAGAGSAVALFMELLLEVMEKRSDRGR